MTSNSERAPQTLTFREAKTGVYVTLVGSMHYNPSSIALATDTVRNLKPAAVLVESCTKRWERTISGQSRGSLLRKVLDNEMQSASEVVEDEGFGKLILADQAIEETNRRMKETFLKSLQDLILFRWKRIADDLKYGYKEAISTGGEDGYLGIADFLDPKLMVAMPASLIRYPLALILKSPLVGSVILGLFASSIANVGDNSFYFDTPLGRLSELGESALLTLVEFAILGRTFLIALLVERNEILAKEIRSACEQISEESGPDSRCAVAVLGMAHCNGVKKLLMK